ncbi:MAG: hypothetical protein SF052_04275 [Bacteroidia bacterium]|nr:hypothetical protein [Bacteroidia bacterium]
MTLNIKDIQPLKGQMSCNLWENSHINLPLTLYYSIEIPLQSFNSGHDYVGQPTNTSIIIEWAIFNDGQNGHQERNWKNLVGRQFNLSYDDKTAEGSIYLGSEHCQFNSQINFLSLNGTTFDIELKMSVDFNIETANLDRDGFVKIKNQVDYNGLQVYHTQLPTFQKADNPLALIENFVDLSVYQTDLTRFNNPKVDWKHLKPRQ